MSLDYDGPSRISVTGPSGRPLTFADLPAPDTRRWVTRRKAEVLAAIHGGLVGREDALRRWRLSEEELLIWEKALACAGVPGLRVTRVQVYRSTVKAVVRKAR